jgi:hypothetical protein
MGFGTAIVASTGRSSVRLLRELEIAETLA